MTETDISKVLIEGEYATIMGVKYKRVEEPKPQTLKELLVEWYETANLVQSKDVIANEIVNIVKNWLKNYHKEDNNKYDFDYHSGWADCIDILERDLR